VLPVGAGLATTKSASREDLTTNQRQVARRCQVDRLCRRHAASQFGCVLKPSETRTGSSSYPHPVQMLLYPLLLVLRVLLSRFGGTGSPPVMGVTSVTSCL
jgi:hypothetical protein